MSSISFHTIGREVRVSGRERAMMGVICNRFLKMQMGDLAYEPLEWVEHVFARGHYIADMAVELRLATNDHEKARLSSRLAQSLETFFHVGDARDVVLLDGEPVDLFALALNSAIQWGNRAVQLAAKLHGQCEIHCYVEGEDRAWLADLIEEAVACDVLRGDVWGYDGWAEVARLLREDAAAPVVTSYSVCDTFPNPSFIPDGIEIDPDDDGRWEAWSRIEPEKQWEYAMAKLRAVSGLRLSPERLDDFFHGGLAGREFMRRAHAAVPAKESEAA
jgi:hypothetical protein